MRELQRQIGLAGLGTFLEQAEEELHEEDKRSGRKRDDYFHSYRPAVIWSVFGKVSIERHYYRDKDGKEPAIPGGGARVKGKRERRDQKTKVRANRHQVEVPK